MSNSRSEKLIFGAVSAVVLLFMYIPLALIVLYSFNKTSIKLCGRSPAFRRVGTTSSRTTPSPRMPHSYPSGSG